MTALKDSKLLRIRILTEWTHPSNFGMVMVMFVHHFTKEGTMSMTTLGIDIAKNVFHVHGRDAAGRPVFQKRFSRAALNKFMANLPSCRVGMEVCDGANYWSRTLQAICEAVLRPTMRFVTPKPSPAITTSARIKRSCTEARSNFVRNK